MGKVVSLLLLACMGWGAQWEGTLEREMGITRYRIGDHGDMGRYRSELRFSHDAYWISAAGEWEDGVDGFWRVGIRDLIKGYPRRDQNEDIDWYGDTRIVYSNSEGQHQGYGGEVGRFWSLDENAFLGIGYEVTWRQWEWVNGRQEEYYYILPNGSLVPKPSPTTTTWNGVGVRFTQTIQRISLIVTDRLAYRGEGWHGSYRVAGGYSMIEDRDDHLLRDLYTVTHGDGWHIKGGVGGWSPLADDMVLGVELTAWIERTSGRSDYYGEGYDDVWVIQDTYTDAWMLRLTLRYY